MKDNGAHSFTEAANYTTEEQFGTVPEKKIRISFGLEAQGHIPTIEAELKRWNDSFNADYPDHKIKDTMTYSKDVWESIGKKIGWCPFTASLAYFKWLKNKDLNQ